MDSVLYSQPKMSLYITDIVSISGKPGLYKVVGRRTTGLIVEAMDGSGKRFPTNLTQKVSFLSDISMYSYDGDAPLAEVLENLHKVAEDGLELVGKKNSGEEIKSFFRKVMENYDEDQVYNSDIVKLVNWYKLLKDKLDFTALTPPEEGDEEE